MCIIRVWKKRDTQPVCPHEGDAAVDECVLLLSPSNPLLSPSNLPENLCCSLGVHSDQEVVGGYPLQDQGKERAGVADLPTVEQPHTHTPNSGVK